jgi:hypothetical protein
MIVGGTLILPLDQFGIIRSFWLVSIGLLILGRSPKGRPPAWEKGDAVPWPSQQQIREEREAARRQAGDAPAEGRRPARGAAKRGADTAASTRRETRVPAARAPQPRRKDAPDEDGDAASRRKRKRRS